MTASSPSIGTVQAKHSISFPSIPWEDRPSGAQDLIWRYSGNPILGRRAIPCAQAIFNSAVIRHGKRFAGVFRADHLNGLPDLHLGWSDDGLAWSISNDPIVMEGSELAKPAWGYDPRVCWIEDRYYITWCCDYYGPTIGVAATLDFQRFQRLENAFLPHNRNGVLFPRKINGRYAMLSRPSDNGHTPFGDIFYSESPDLCHWGRHRLVMSAGNLWWESVKIGAGAVPLETSEGWLLLYHGVRSSCNGFVYSMGAALLDLEEPWKVKSRLAGPILMPERDYEVCGSVPNVVFPCAMLHEETTGQIAIYYGAADTYVGLAFAWRDELVQELLSGSRF